MLKNCFLAIFSIGPANECYCEWENLIHKKSDILFQSRKKEKKKKINIFVSYIYRSSKGIIFLFSLLIYQIINFTFKVVRL